MFTAPMLAQHVDSDITQSHSTLPLRLLHLRQSHVHQHAGIAHPFAFLAAGLSWSKDAQSQYIGLFVLDSVCGISHAPVDMDLAVFLEDASKMMCLYWV